MNEFEADNPLPEGVDDFALLPADGPRAETPAPGSTGTRYWGRATATAVVVLFVVALVTAFVLLHNDDSTARAPPKNDFPAPTLESSATRLGVPSASEPLRTTTPDLPPTPPRVPSPSEPLRTPPPDPPPTPPRVPTASEGLGRSEVLRPQLPSSWRLWRDSSGRTFEGALEDVGLGGGSVRVRKKDDGKLYEFRTELLSNADQQYVKALAEMHYRKARRLPSPSDPLRRPTPEPPPAPPEVPSPSQPRGPLEVARSWKLWADPSSGRTFEATVEGIEPGGWVLLRRKEDGKLQRLRLDLEYANAYFGGSSAYANKGVFDKAIAQSTEAIRLNPEDALAYIRRGYAYAQKHQFGKAVDDYTEAIRLDPENADAYSRRGSAYAEKGEKTKAEADFAKAKELGSRSD